MPAKKPKRAARDKAPKRAIKTQKAPRRMSPVLNLQLRVELPVGPDDGLVELTPLQFTELMSASPDLYRACRSAYQLLKALRLGTNVRDELKKAMSKAYKKRK